MSNSTNTSRIIAIIIGMTILCVFLLAQCNCGGKGERVERRSKRSRTQSVASIGSIGHSYLGKITGAYLDTSSQQLFLIGDGDPTYPQMSPQAIATAFQWAFTDSPTYNFVSIDPVSPSSSEKWMKVRINRDAQDTEFGNIMFEADRLAKVYSLGKDNITQKSIQSNIPGYQDIFSLSSTANQRDNSAPNWNRFWLYSHSNEVEADSQHFWINEASLGLKTEPMKWQNGELVSDPNRMDKEYETFADFFTKNYWAFAKEQKVFAQLDQLHRLLLISNWIHDYKVPLLKQFIRIHQDETYRIPRYTPTITVTKTEVLGRTTRTQSLYGGTDLNVVNNYVQAKRSRFRELDKDFKEFSRDFNSEVITVSTEEGEYSAQALNGTINAIQTESEVEVILSLNYINLSLRKSLNPYANNPFQTISNQELAIPSLERYFPNGKNGQYEKVGIQGHPESQQTKQNFQLYAPNGEHLGSYDKYEIDQQKGRFQMHAKGGKGWVLYPEENAIFAAKDNEAWIFDPQTGLFLGTQSGNTIIRYKWATSEIEGNPEHFLQEIFTDGTEAMERVFIERGSNGQLINGLRTNTGKSVQLPALDKANLSSRPVQLEVTLSGQPNTKSSIEIDPQTGDVTFPQMENFGNELRIFEKHSHQIVQKLGNSESQAGGFLIQDGAHSMWVNNRSRQVTVYPQSLPELVAAFESGSGKPNDFPLRGVESVTDDQKILLFLEDGSYTAAILKNGRLIEEHYGNKAYQMFKNAPRDYVKAKSTGNKVYLHAERSRNRVLINYGEKTLRISENDLESLISTPEMKSHPVDELFQTRRNEKKNVVVYRNGMERAATMYEEIQYPEMVNMNTLYHALRERQIRFHADKNLNFYKDDEINKANRNIESMDQISGPDDFAFWIDEASFTSSELDSIYAIAAKLERKGIQRIHTLGKQIPMNHLIVFTGAKGDLEKDPPNGGVGGVLHQLGLSHMLERKMIYLMNPKEEGDPDLFHEIIETYDAKAIYHHPASTSIETVDVYLDWMSDYLVEIQKGRTSTTPDRVVREPILRYLGGDTSTSLSPRVKREFPTILSGGFQISWMRIPDPTSNPDYLFSC